MSGWTPPPRDPFVDLADEAAHEAAVHARVEQRSRSEHAAELATWIGTLRDLAERGVPVSLQARSGRSHRGALIAVGADHVALRLRSGTVILIALAAARTVRPEPGQVAPPAMGDRESAQDRTLVETFARFVEIRQTVVVSVRDVEDLLQGEVIGFGEDVVTLRLGGTDRGTVYLPLAAIDEVLLEW